MKFKLVEIESPYSRATVKRLSPRELNNLIKYGTYEVSETVSVPNETVCNGETVSENPLDLPALYYFAEIQALSSHSPEDLQQIHLAKLAYPGARLIQEGRTEP